MCKWILLFCAIFSVGICLDCYVCVWTMQDTSCLKDVENAPIINCTTNYCGIQRIEDISTGDLLVYLRGCATNHNTDANFDGKRYTYSSCSTKLCNNGGSRVSATAIIPALIISAAVALKQII